MSKWSVTAAIAKELNEMARLGECTTAEAEFGARYAALNPNDFESLRSSEQADHALSLARVYLREVV